MRRALFASQFIAICSSIGINLGNVLEAPREGDWAPAAQEEYFSDYKAAGFQLIRIPVRWDKHTGTSPPFAIDAAFLDRVVTIVGWATSRNLTAIINSHHDDWMDSEANFSASLPRFLTIWAQVAARFAAHPVAGGGALRFEVINEPINLTIASLNALYAAVVPVMRQGGSNGAREIYLGGLSWMSPYWIEKNPDGVAFPPLAGGGADPHLRLEVHSYDPYAFCLQSPPTQSTWGSPADVKAVDDMYGAMASWAASRGRAVLMGECGCQVAAPSREGRLAWYKTIGAAQELLDDGACLWDDNGSWKIYNRGERSWDEGVLEAIGLKR